MTDTAKINLLDASAEFIVSNKTERGRVKGLMNEKDILKLILKDINKSDVFYDVGANIGIYSMLIADKIGDENVVAFEPHPNNVNHLQKNANINSYDDMSIIDYALFDSNKVQTIKETGIHPGEGEHYIDKNQGTLNIKTNTGDKLIDEFHLPKPDIIKIDVEGAEVRVLNGMLNSINDCRYILIEVHPSRMIERYNNSMGDIIDIAKTYKFKVNKISSRGKEKYIKLENND